MCPLELVATPMPSPRYRLGGIFRKFGADSNGIWGTFRAFARALSCAGVRVSAGVCANWGMAQTSAAHSRQVLVYISLLLFFPPHPVVLAGRLVQFLANTARLPSDAVGIRLVSGPPPDAAPRAASASTRLSRTAGLRARLRSGPRLAYSLGPERLHAQNS